MFLRAIFACVLVSCSAPSEARRIAVPFSVAPLATPSVTTVDGYVVTLSEARVAIHDLSFAVGGEAATAIERWLIRPAYAHPGHYSGGAITGELRGRFDVDFLNGTVLGDATLIVGDYESANLGLSADAGHTAVLRGTAAKSGATITFTAEIDSPPDREITGIPFVMRVDTSAPITLELSLEDPYEHDTLFDGIDFAALDSDHDGAVTITGDAYDTLKRTFQTHDHFRCRRAAED